MFESAAPVLTEEEPWPVPPEQVEQWSAEDERLYGDILGRPSGWAAFELDADTHDPTRLSDAELIEAMAGFERTAAWAQARQARVIAEFTRRRPPDDRSLAGTDRVSVTSPFAPDEVGLALRLSRWSATARIGQSVELVERLPDTLEAWEAGHLDERRVTAICDATRTLPVETARAVQHRVLLRAPEQTLAQLKAALRRAVVLEDPRGAAARHRVARTERRVAVLPEQDGMASLWARLAAPDALACHQWLTRLARGLGTDDPRGMDARRADLLVALLTGQATHAPAATDGPAHDTAHAGCDTGPLPQPVAPGKPLVQVLMPFHTLLGADGPCELVGYGAVHAELAREIATDATLKRLVFDPLTGALLDHGRSTYRPPAALADHVRARDVYCRAPGCRRRVVDGELDHVVPFPGGPTSAANLAGYCGHHHRAKHTPGWRVRTLPDGRLEWTTPTGHRYTSAPFDHRLDDDPPLIRPGPERAPPPATVPSGADPPSPV